MLDLNEITIETASKNDVFDVFKLVNQPEIRAISLNPNPILLENHEAWFLSKISEISCLFFIIRHKKDFIGYVRFENKNNENVISIALSSDVQGMGIGAFVIEKSSRLAKDKIGAPIFAYIKSDNHKSIKSFTKAGYKELSKSDITKMVYE